MVSLAWVPPGPVARPAQLVAVRETMKPAECGPQRDRPFPVPARLAVGLGLGSDPDACCHASCAPSLKLLEGLREFGSPATTRRKAGWLRLRLLSKTRERDRTDPWFCKGIRCCLGENLGLESAPSRPVVPDRLSRTCLQSRFRLCDFVLSHGLPIYDRLPDVVIPPEEGSRALPAQVAIDT